MERIKKPVAHFKRNDFLKLSIKYECPNCGYVSFRIVKCPICGEMLEQKISI